MGYTRDGVALASAARTVETVSEWFSSGGAEWLMIMMDWTIEAASSTLTLSIEGLDPASGKPFTVWTAASALTAIGGDSAVVGVKYAIGTALLASAVGGLTDTENVPVPSTWRVKVAVGDSDSSTYSVGYMLGGGGS